MATVAELFDNDQVVQQVVSELYRHQFGEDRVWVLDQAQIEDISGNNIEARTEADNPSRTLSDLGIPPDTARFYLEGIKQGGQVVVVQTSSERAAEARNILKRAAAEP